MNTKRVVAAIGLGLLMPTSGMATERASKAARELDHFSIFEDGVVVHATKAHKESAHVSTDDDLEGSISRVAERAPASSAFALLTPHRVRHDGIESNVRSAHDVFEHEPDATWRASLLVEGTRAAWSTDQDDLAKRRAEALLALVPELALDEAIDATHLAHTVLGLCALHEGAVNVAARHLTAAAPVVSSASLRSEGPSFELARELLDKGRRGAVLGYLRRVGRVWQDDHGCLAAWRATIEAGDTPDFSARECAAR